MKPFSNFIILALAIVIFTVPIISPTISANDSVPVSASSKYSIYRAWDDISLGAPGSGSTLDHYGDIATMVDNNQIVVDGRLQSDPVPVPYETSVWSEHLPATVYTNAEYDICWLDEDLEKQTHHFAPQTDSYFTGAFGIIEATLYRDYGADPVDLGDCVPIYTNKSAWIEDITISVYLPDPDLYTTKKVAEYKQTAAFCEQIFLMAQYNDDATPDWAISDNTNHPSTTAPLWQGASVDGQWYGAPLSEYDESMAQDWVRHEAIMDDRYADDVSNRSALYGYAQSIRSRLMSVYNWQLAYSFGSLEGPSLRSLSNGTADYERSYSLLYSAYSRLETVEGEITSGGSMSGIREELTEALREYQLSILYMDNAIIMDVYREPVGGDYTVEEWRELYIDLYIAPGIAELELPRLTFSSWIVTPIGAVLVGSMAALGVVAAIWRNDIAGILALCALMLTGMIWATEAGL